MMDFNSLDYEKIDTLFNDMEAGEMELFALTAEGASPPKSDDVLQAICKTWKGVRAVMTVLTQLKLLPKKWRNGIEKFMGLIDLLCTLKK